MSTAAPTGPQAPQRRLQVAVHNGHCHLYALCQQEAPEVFRLRSDTRLQYDTSPPAHLAAKVFQAARVCPTQAISVEQT